MLQQFQYQEQYIVPSPTLQVCCFPTPFLHILLKGLLVSRHLFTQISPKSHAISTLHKISENRLGTKTGIHMVLTHAHKRQACLSKVKIKIQGERFHPDSDSLCWCSCTNFRDRGCHSEGGGCRKDVVNWCMEPGPAPALKCLQLVTLSECTFHDTAGIKYLFVLPRQQQKSPQLFTFTRPRDLLRALNQNQFPTA